MKFTARKERRDTQAALFSFRPLKHTRGGQKARLPPPHPKYGKREKAATQILLVSLKPDAPGHFVSNLTPGHHRSPANPLPGPPPVLTEEPLGNSTEPWEPV